MPRTTTNYRKLTTIAVLSALSAVLMFIQIGLPILPPHLKVDFSDLPAVIGAYAYGPIAGIVIELIKNLFHLITTTTSGVGELSNFLHGVCFVLPAGLIYRYRKDKIGALWGAAAGVAATTAASFVLNYFLTFPLYMSVLGIPRVGIVSMYSAILPAADTFAKAILIFHLPLTFVKSFVCMLVTFFVYKRISPLLHGYERNK